LQLKRDGGGERQSCQTIAFIGGAVVVVADHYISQCAVPAGTDIVLTGFLKDIYICLDYNLAQSKRQKTGRLKLSSMLSNNGSSLLSGEGLRKNTAPHKYRRGRGRGRG